MKIKKLISMGLAAIMAVSAISMTALAADTNSFADVENEMYDDDMVYVQEDADIVAEYNARLYDALGTSSIETASTNAVAATTYTAWNWNSGIYTVTSGVASAIAINRYFVPTANYLYFNAEVEFSHSVSSSDRPRVSINKLNSDNSLTYVGSYYITLTDSSNYIYSWSNKKITVTSGQKYVVGFLADTNWINSSLNIYKSAM